MADTPVFTTRPGLAGTFGMVASTHWIASAAGMAVLEHGGKAFDAAVAAGLVLQVVEPHLNGPGGDLPAILYDAKGDDVVVLCGQGPAPQAATIDAFRRRGIDLIPGTGLLPAVAINSALVAVMRRNGERAADYARRHNVPRWYDRADALIHDAEVDAVYIATPPGSRPKTCRPYNATAITTSAAATTAGRCELDSPIAEKKT